MADEKKPKNEPAFPVDTMGLTGHQSGAYSWQYPGMTLRDYFAAHAPAHVTDPENWDVGMCAAKIGLASHLEYKPAEHWPLVVAKLSYEWADAMLRARGEG